MITIIFILACFILFWVTGIIITKLIRVPDELLNKNGILLFPGIGLLFLINMVQVMNLFMPCSYLLIPFILFLVVGVYKNFDSIICSFAVIMNGKAFLMMILAAILLWSVPLLASDGLTSIQSWNNDIMYYLSSMDWLKDHNSMQKVLYNDNNPYYWCAEYMQERTRTGFDGLGSFIMELSGLEAYEIFTSLGIVFGIIMLFHIYFVSGSVLNMRKKSRLLLLALIICSCRFEELLIYQYIPQICGISFLILFIGLMIHIVNKKIFSHGILALVMAGIISVYAEYCAYLLVIYMSAFIVGGVVKKDRKKMIFMIKEGFFALLINPVGIYRAVKINLFIFHNVQVDMDQIDPFYGKVSTTLNAFAQSLGLLQTEGYGEVLQILICIMLFLCFLFFIFLIFSYVKRIRDSNKVYLLTVLVFLFIYEIYFRLISYGYGEYKHLLSLTSFLLMFTLYIAHWVCDFWQPCKIVKVVLIGFITCITISGVISNIKFFDKDSLYYYDSSVEQLEEGARLVPIGETIGVSGTPASIHGMVYGLRSRPTTILANNISYFPFSKEGASRYRMYEGMLNEREAEMNEEMIWSNGRFYLIKNTGLQSCFYGGFHAKEYEHQEIVRFTCDQEASIYVYNFSEETKNFSLKFQTQKVGDEERRISVMADGIIIAEGEVGDFIVTNPIYLNPDEKVRIYLYDSVPTKEIDERTIGYRISNYALIEF